ncbi:unnamed protein product [Protopolystoma xenopodis]|uniref:Uncharacterized protein n=1 Tax=Protopolystoma xenopodis TaxID=117903 RepID=A0A448XSM9_9PLAT|nr:unnamed protein product [Protopolystoma xenopodis]
MMVESSARFHSKRGRKSCGLRQHERRIKANWLQYNEVHLSSSGEIDVRISSSRTLMRNESPPNELWLPWNDTVCRVMHWRPWMCRRAVNETTIFTSRARVHLGMMSDEFR